MKKANLGRRHLSFVVVSFLVSIEGRAELGNPALHLLPQIPGVLNGRRTEDSSLKFAKSVVALEVTKGKKAESGICSGTVIEGCIFTSGHCVGDEMAIKSGTDLGSDKRHKGIGIATEFKKLGDTQATDLAIVKPKRPLSKEISQPISILTKKHFKGKKDESILGIVGWGVSETREKFDEESGKTTREDFGSGVKRYGNLTYQGDDDDDMISYNRSKTAQVAGPGDSGAPVFVEYEGGEVELVGVHQGSQRATLKGEKKDETRSNDNKMGFAVSIGAHLDWIKKTLKELKCAPGEGGGGLEAFLRKEFAPLKDAQKAWDKDEKWQKGAEKLKELKELVLEELKNKGEIKTPWNFVSVNVKVEDGKLKIIWSAALADNREEDNAKFSKLGLERGGLSRPMGTLEYSIDE